LPVCDEYPVSLELNGERVVTLLCTPCDLTELAVGWLYCEGLIDGVDEVLAVGGCDQLSRMRVFTEGQRPLVQSEWRRVITSGCGSGHAIDPQELAALPAVTSDLRFPLPRLEELMRDINLAASRAGTKVAVTHDIDAAFDGAQVVYAKSWGSSRFYGDAAADTSERARYRADWIVDEAKMRRTDDALFMHCLPVRRNCIVTDGVIDSPSSVVIDEAENRLHVQKAIMTELLGGER
jgi:hypothetical protein